ncbi:hypothetical protein BT63DRAFT_450180 [Microthyrium microscopicum]|uniref:YTH domain-containing protein n=1 Tax=Microthyrium microscopicum TaxID=703497 RepID=A0A6A6UTU7_9PEZI|nr:hypothetical protein BT63DRAFT_450180 [Microthyrium microscopicum]
MPRSAQPLKDMHKSNIPMEGPQKKKSKALATRTRERSPRTSTMRRHGRSRSPQSRESTIRSRSPITSFFQYQGSTDIAFFIVKPLNVEVLQESMIDGLWAQNRRTEQELREAFNKHQHVFLIFHWQKKKLQTILGYARLKLPPSTVPLPNWYDRQSQLSDSRGMRLEWLGKVPFDLHADALLAGQLAKACGEKTRFSALPHFKQIDSEVGGRICDWLSNTALVQAAHDKANDMDVDNDHGANVMDVDNGRGANDMDVDKARGMDGMDTDI